MPQIKHEPKLRWLLKDVLQVILVAIVVLLLLAFIIPELFQIFGLKILGLFLILFGIFFVKDFPDITKYQSELWSWGGIKFGFIIIVIGILLLLWG